MTVYVMKLDFYMCTEVPDIPDSCLSHKVSMLDMQKKKTVFTVAKPINTDVDDTRV